MRKLSLILFIFFLSLQVQATTLIVSDIDDTIKKTHILNRAEALESMFHAGPEIAFFGMPELYRALATSGDVQFAYVSNAPDVLMESAHKEFLSRSHFPEGSLHLPGTFSRKDHKLRSILDLVSKIRPERVILIGDNGEKDPVIYQELAGRLQKAGVETSTWIHRIYSTSPKALEKGSFVLQGQNSFVTVSEITAGLEKLGFLSRESANQLLNWLWMHNELARLPVWVNSEGHKINSVLQISKRHEDSVASRCESVF